MVFLSDIIDLLTSAAEAKGLLQLLPEEERKENLKRVTTILNKLQRAVDRKLKAAERLQNECKSDLAELRKVEVTLKEAVSKAQLDEKRCVSTLQALQAVRVAPTQTKSKIICKATSKKPGFISSVELRKRAKKAGIPVTKRKKKDICEDFTTWLEQYNR